MTVTLTVVTYQRSSSWLTGLSSLTRHSSNYSALNALSHSALRPQDVGVAFKIRSDWLTSNGFQIRLHSSRSGDIYTRGPRTPTPRNNLHNPRKRLACGLPYSPYSSYRSRWRHYIAINIITIIINLDALNTILLMYRDNVMLSRTSY